MGITGGIKGGGPVIDKYAIPGGTGTGTIGGRGGYDIFEIIKKKTN